MVNYVADDFSYIARRMKEQAAETTGAMSRSTYLLARQAANSASGADLDKIGELWGVYRKFIINEGTESDHYLRLRVLAEIEGREQRLRSIIEC